MVCNRCIAAVEKIFNDLEIDFSSVDLGEVTTATVLNEKEIQHLDDALREDGFQILNDYSKQLIEKIKNVIILKINILDISEDFTLSKFLTEKIHKDYSPISKTF